MIAAIYARVSTVDQPQHMSFRAHVSCDLPRLHHVRWIVIRRGVTYEPRHSDKQREQHDSQ
jgi:hypothetical protein